MQRVRDGRPLNAVMIYFQMTTATTTPTAMNDHGVLKVSRTHQELTTRLWPNIHATKGIKDVVCRLKVLKFTNFDFHNEIMVKLIIKFSTLFFYQYYNVLLLKKNIKNNNNFIIIFYYYYELLNF